MASIVNLQNYAQRLWPPQSGYVAWGTEVDGKFTADTTGATRTVTCTCWASKVNASPATLAQVTSSKSATAVYADANPSGQQAAIGLQFDGPIAGARNVAVATACGVLEDAMLAAVTAAGV